MNRGEGEVGTMLASLRILDQGMLCRLDLISVYLGIAYSIVNKIILHQTSTTSTLFMVAIGLLTYLAKRREKVVYAAAAYALLSIVVASWLHHRLDFVYHSYYVLIPIAMFVVVMLMEWQTSWITGMLLGLWGLLAVLSYGERGLYGIEQFDTIRSQMPLLLLGGLLVYLISRSTIYAYSGERVDKLDFILILLAIGYGWSVWTQPGEPVLLAVLYTAFAVFTAYAKAGSSRWTAPTAYALFALIVCLKLKQAFAMDSLYLIILMPMAMFGLSLVFSFRTYLITGVALGYWLAVLFLNIRADATGIPEQIRHLFSYDTSMEALSGVWWMVVLAILIVHPSWFKFIRRAVRSVSR